MVLRFDAWYTARRHIGRPPHTAAARLKPWFPKRRRGAAPHAGSLDVVAVSLGYSAPPGDTMLDRFAAGSADQAPSFQPPPASGGAVQVQQASPPWPM